MALSAREERLILTPNTCRHGAAIAPSSHCQSHGLRRWSTMPSLSIFEIPPVQEVLASFLSPNELARCSRVCLLWRDAFTPYVYRTIDITSLLSGKRLSSPEALAALARNRRYVRSIKAKDLDLLFATALASASHPSVAGSEIKDGVIFPNLRRFDCTWPRRKGGFGMPTPSTLEYTDQANKALELMARHPRLEVVVLRVHTLLGEHAQTLASILRQDHVMQRQRGDRYTCLRKLHVEVNDTAPSLDDSIRELFEAAASYSRSSSAATAAESLTTNAQSGRPLEPLEEWNFEWIVDTFQFDDEQEDGNYDGELTGQIVEQSYGAGDIFLADCGLRDVTIALPHAQWERQLFLPFLKRCTELERLCLPWIHSSSVLRRLPMILKSHCRKLRQLEIGSFYSSDSELAQLMGACVAGLESFSVQDRQPMKELTIQTIIRLHSNTLETLDLSFSHRSPSHLFLDLISHCPHLRTLKASLDLVITDEYSRMIDYQPRFAVDWPFRNCLKVLDLTLYRGAEAEDEPRYRLGNGTLTDLYIDYMYNQVGALLRLEELSLGGWMLLLQVERGLTKLAGLKQLRVLDLRSHTFVRWSPADVEWICENWTGLREILGMKSPNARAAIDLLKSKRPWIEIK